MNMYAVVYNKELLAIYSQYIHFFDIANNRRYINYTTNHKINHTETIVHQTTDLIITMHDASDHDYIIYTNDSDITDSAIAIIKAIHSLNQF